jgi:hypothetical protein
VGPRRRDTHEHPDCKIGSWAVLGPSDTKKCREAWKSSENVPPVQLRYVTLLPLMTKHTADEPAYAGYTDSPPPNPRNWVYGAKTHCMALD